MTVERVHIRVRYAQLGGHVHCAVWTAETGGADATHDSNGRLTFRIREFEAFRDTLKAGDGLAVAGL